jgi:putative transcriptional regulator
MSNKRIVLQRRRKKKKVTQQDMAEILDISPVYYGMIERGERNPTLELAKNIADVLDSTVDEIFFNEKLYKMNSDD